MHRIIAWSGLLLSPLLPLVNWHFLFGIWFMIGVLWWLAWQPTFWDGFWNWMKGENE